MNKAQIFILILFVTGGGIGAYLFLKKKKEEDELLKKQEAQQSALDLAAAQKKRNDFCNPPISNAYEKIAYQKKLAQAEWESRGRGMDLDYFIEQYKKEIGCP